MGWTSYHASHYKVKNGIRTVDRKAECDAYFMEGLNKGHFNLLKSTMIGSTYYAAVQGLKRSAGKDENDNYIYEDIPENERETFAVVFLTYTDMKDHFNFSYKPMDETVGPCQHNCPKGILDLLSPTESQWANEWRQKCRENLQKKKNPNALNKLPVGTKIKVIMPFATRYHNVGDEVILTKCLNWKGNRSAWYKGSIKFTAGLMKMLEENYEVVSLPNRKE
jgi:hypothetical protein